MNSQKLRVLVVDDDPQVGQDLCQLLDETRFTVMRAQGQGDALYLDAIEKMSAWYPHLAVVDLALYGWSDRRGFDLLKQAACGRVIYSDYANAAAAMRGMTEYGAETLNKRESSAQELVDGIIRAAGTVYDFSHTFQPIWPAAWTPALILRSLFDGQEHLPDDVVEGVLWQLFHDAKGGTTESVHLETLDGNVPSPGAISRGRSVVLRASQPGRRVPEVLKLTAGQDATRERVNYEWIDGRVDGPFMARLRQSAVFWKLGGLAYELLRGAPGHSIVTLASFYAETRDARQIIKPISDFFERAWRPLYDDSRPYDRPLAEIYGDEPGSGRRLASDDAAPGKRWEPSLSGLYNGWLHLERHAGILAQMGPSVRLPQIQLALRNPIAWLAEHASESCLPGLRVAITHGDLHAGNLMVDAEHGWAIDFERTGPSHWLRDFVELEVDIVTRLLVLDDGRTAPFLRLAVMLQETPDLQAPLVDHELLIGLKTKREVNKAVAVIQGLRGIVHTVTHGVDMREYRWGLLLDSVFAAAWAEENRRRVTDQAEQRRHSLVRDRALLLGAVLCDRLENTAGQWGLRDQVLAQLARPARPDGREAPGPRRQLQDAAVPNLLGQPTP